MDTRKLLVMMTLACLFSSHLLAEEPVAVVGSMAPDFSLLDSEGVEVRLSDYLGEVIVLGFVDSNHGYCSTILPELQAVNQDFGDAVVLGVDVIAEPAVDLEETMGIFSINFPLLLQGEAVAILYDMRETGAVLIDRAGLIRARALASINEEFLAALSALLSE